jgi:hypothetical protein
MDKIKDISLQELNYIVQATAAAIFFVVGTVALLYFGLAMGY